jgi:hypothetical protein
METAGAAAADKHSDGTYAVLSLKAKCDGLARGPEGQVLAAVRRGPLASRAWCNGFRPAARRRRPSVFGTDSAEQSLALQSQGAWQTLKQYLVDGMWHIWIGYDHILFLLSLLLPLGAGAARKVHGNRTASLRRRAKCSRW